MSEPEFLQHFAKCTGMVLDGARVVGSGFFVSPVYFVTCAHVVEGLGDEIKVAYKRDLKESRLESTYIVQKSGNPRSLLDSPPDEHSEPDLAIFRIKENPPDDRSVVPSVLLADEIPNLGDPLYSFGYPTGEYVGESVLLNYEGPAYDRQDRQILTLREGNIRPGMSGAPLLNRKTGKVCGIVFASKDVRYPNGGRAFPIRFVFDMVPETKDANRLAQADAPIWSHLWKGQQGAVLLKEFPRGPVPDENQVSFAFIRAVANVYATPISAKEIVVSANRLRLEADSDGGTIAVSDLPFGNPAPFEYWVGVFNAARLQGPKMLAALTLVIDDWQFPDDLRKERQGLLDYLRTL